MDVRRGHPSESDIEFKKFSFKTLKRMRTGILTPSSHTFNHYNVKLNQLNLIRISRIDDLRGRTWDNIILCHDSFGREIPSECFDFIEKRKIKTTHIDDILKENIVSF